MLTIGRSSLILSSLAMNGYIDYTKPPSNWFDNVNTGVVDVLHNTTGYDKDVLQEFVKVKIPCIRREMNTTDGVATTRKLLHIVENKCTGESESLLIFDQLCGENNIDASIRLFMFFMAMLFMLILSTCVNRRKKLCTSCCGGFPGPVTPLNMLDSYENRLGFSLAFSITIVSCINVLLGNYDQVVGTHMASEIATYPAYVGTLLKIMFAFYVSIISIPFFICQSMMNKVLGAIIGLFFSALWLSLDLYKGVYLFNECWSKYAAIDNEAVPVLGSLITIPRTVCLILLFGKFVHVIRTVIKQRRKNQKKGMTVNWIYQDDTNWQKEYMYIHVENLLKFSKRDANEKLGDIDSSSVTLKENFKSKMIEKLYTYKPGFKYSTRVLASTLVSICAVYLLMIVAIIFGYQIFTRLWDSIYSSETMELISIITEYDLDELKLYGYCIAVSWWAATVIAVIFYGIVLSNCVTWYRRHVMMLRIGDYSFIPNSVKKKSVSCQDLMVASMKFAGYQVGYSFWGVVVIAGVILLIFVIISTQLLLPLKTGKLTTVLTLIKNFWPTIIIAVVISMVQQFISHTWFLMSEDTLAVDNRQAFHAFSYVMFYFNIFLGLVSCLLRIIFGVLFGVLFLQRLQKSTLPRTFERRDPGYLAYVGYILLEHQHANPVLQCFVRLLLATQNKQLEQNEFVEHSKQESVSTVALMIKNNPLYGVSFVERTVNGKFSSVLRARTRWFLYLTLAKNPSLVKYRKAVLKTKRMKHIEKALLGVLQFLVNNETIRNIKTNEEPDQNDTKHVQEEFLHADITNVNADNNSNKERTSDVEVQMSIVDIEHEVDETEAQEAVVDISNDNMNNANNCLTGNVTEITNVSDDVSSENINFDMYQKSSQPHVEQTVAIKKQTSEVEDMFYQTFLEDKGHNIDFVEIFI